MIQLKFKLDQHTPMLHFQPAQQGATLRATEVKPRFDKWLVRKAWSDDYSRCKKCNSAAEEYKPSAAENIVKGGIIVGC